MAKSLTARIKANAAGARTSGNTLLGLMLEAFDQYATSGDWTNLAWIVAANSHSDRKRLSAIIEAVGGVKFTSDTKQPTGLRKAKTKGEDAETNQTALLEEYYKRGVSFRSVLLEEGVEGELAPLLVKKDPKLRSVEEIIASAVKKARKDQPELATDARIIEALRIALAAE